jgi:uncharacterized membrane protein
MNDGKIDIQRYIGEGWRHFTANGVVFAVTTLAVMVVYALASAIPFAPLLVNGPLMAGLFLLALDTVRGRTPTFARLGGVAPYIGPIVMVGLLTSVFSGLGFVLFLIPGFLVTGWYLFAYLFAVDKELGFWEAMEKSRLYGFDNHLSVFLFALVLGLINFLGALPLGLGLLVTVPVSILAVTTAYEELLAKKADVPTPNAVTPPPPPL